MSEWFFIGLGLFLIAVAIIDIKARAIPSIMLTAGLFVVMALNQGNIFYGLLAFVLSYLFYEADFFGGVADIKVFTLFGFLFSSMFQFGMFIVFFAIFGIIWKIIYKVKNPKDDECPFLPVFVIIYFAMLLGGII